MFVATTGSHASDVIYQVNEKFSYHQQNAR